MKGDDSFGTGMAVSRICRSTDKIDSRSLELFCTAEEILTNELFINNIWLINFSFFFFSCSFNLDNSLEILSILNEQLQPKINIKLNYILIIKYFYIYYKYSYFG